MRRKRRRVGLDADLDAAGIGGAKARATVLLVTAGFAARATGRADRTARPPGVDGGTTRAAAFARTAAELPGSRTSTRGHAEAQVAFAPVCATIGIIGARSSRRHTKGPRGALSRRRRRRHHDAGQRTASTGVRAVRAERAASCAAIPPGTCVDGPIGARLDAPIDGPIPARIDAHLGAPIDTHLGAPIDARVDGFIDACIDGLIGAHVRYTFIRGVANGEHVDRRVAARRCANHRGGEGQRGRAAGAPMVRTGHHVD
jgi:hypothetical protein